jgi:hypothetical protein
MTNEVIVVEYDPRWPRLIEEEKAQQQSSETVSPSHTDTEKPFYSETVEQFEKTSFYITSE